MIFAIETSCDETSTAVLSLEGKLLSHIIVNQQNHNKFGGVVPEIASRAHLEILQTIIPQSLNKAKIEFQNIEIFAATSGPGLIGGLLVGSIVLIKTGIISISKSHFATWASVSIEPPDLM